MNVALYGGSFDPPHAGHVLAAAYLTTIANFDRVLVVPVFDHAFEKSLSPFERRLTLCRLAFARLSDVEVSDIESELTAPSYTISTVRLLLSRNPCWRLRVVVGTDVLPEIDRWHEIDELQTLAPLYVLGRRGSERADASRPLLPDVSSTQIRAWLAESSREHPRRELVELVPPDVLDAIFAWGLYQKA